MKNIVGKIIDKLSIAKLLIAAGFAATATTIALVVKALKKRLAAKRAKAMAQPISLSELEEEIEEAVEETDSDDSFEETPEIWIMDDTEESVEDPFGTFDNTLSDNEIEIEEETTDLQNTEQNSEPELDDEWYKKTLADLFNDESFLEPDEEYENPVMSQFSPEEIKKAKFAIEQCEKMSDKIHKKIRQLGVKCPSEYHQLSTQIAFAKIRLINHYGIVDQLCNFVFSNIFIITKNKRKELL